MTKNFIRFFKNPVGYMNPKNKDGFFRDWYKSDEIKLDYILIGFAMIITFVMFVLLYFEA